MRRSNLISGPLVIPLLVVLPTAAFLIGPASTDIAASRHPAHTSVVTEPTPTVSAADFPIEPEGQAPSDNDGLIPNPETPTGQVVGTSSPCNVKFVSSAGATSQTLNTWISKNENAITSPTLVCLSGTFTSPIHIWSKASTALLEIAPEPGQTATLDL